MASSASPPKRWVSSVSKRSRCFFKRYARPGPTRAQPGPLAYPGTHPLGLARTRDPLLHVPPDGLERLTEVIARALLVLAVWQFCHAFAASQSAARAAVLLTLFGSGFEALAGLFGLPYTGNWSAMEGLIAAFAVLMPDAQIFLYFVPVQAKWMLPISAGITVLFMLMTGWQPYLPQLFGLGAGVLFAGGVSPGNVFLRAKVWWIDRRLRRNRLRVVRGDDVRSGSRGSDKYLH